MPTLRSAAWCALVWKLHNGPGMQNAAPSSAARAPRSAQPRTRVLALASAAVLLAGCNERSRMPAAEPATPDRPPAPAVSQPPADAPPEAPAVASAASPAAGSGDMRAFAMGEPYVECTVDEDCRKLIEAAAVPLGKWHHRTRTLHRAECVREAGCSPSAMCGCVFAYPSGRLAPQLLGASTECDIHSKGPGCLFGPIAARSRVSCSLQGALAARHLSGPRAPRAAAAVSPRGTLRSAATLRAARGGRPAGRSARSRPDRPTRGRT